MSSDWADIRITLVAEESDNAGIMQSVTTTLSDSTLYCGTHTIDPDATSIVTKPGEDSHVTYYCSLAMNLKRHFQIWPLNICNHVKLKLNKRMEKIHPQH